MRIYTDCKELMSEAFRDVFEMGAIVKPKTYQNKVIDGKDEFITKEVIGYQYCLTSLNLENMLYIADARSKDWVEAELKERLTPHTNPGEAWKLRPELWEQFITENDHFDYTYSERFNDPVGFMGARPINLVIKLLVDDPDTRKAILPIFTISDVVRNDGSARIPCSMYYNFMVREDSRGIKKLHISYHQRSSDVITHFGNDVALAFKMMEYVAESTGYQPGYLYHTIDSLHSYKKDWEQLGALIGQMK